MDREIEEMAPRSPRLKTSKDEGSSLKSRVPLGVLFIRVPYYIGDLKETLIWKTSHESKSLQLP